MKTLLAIDGNSILNRAFYGVRPLSNRDGLPTNALFGMTNMILKQLELYQPTYAAIAFDVHAPTFRHKMYDEYKAGRKPMPEELRRQLPYAKKVARALGFHVLEKEGYEADDILGTLAQMADDMPDTLAYIMTGDRDSLQLIDARVSVLLATNQETIRFDRETFFEKYGVWPEQYVDVKALMGDSSDHIPGVPGVGEKTAFGLIAQFGSLDGVYEHLDDPFIKKAARTKLTEGKESAYMSKTLSTICREVPLGLALEDLQSDGMDRVFAGELFTELEFSGFIKRFSLDKLDKTDEDSGRADRHPISITEVEPNSLPQSPKWAVTAREDADGQLLFCNGENIYACNADPTALSRVLGAADTRVVCYDCKTLYKLLARRGIDFSYCTMDVMLGAYAVDATGKFDLSALILSYLGETRNESVPDVQYIYDLEEPILEKLRQTEQIEVFRRIEMPLALVLADMELTGFKIDREGIRLYGEQLDKLTEELQSRIYYAAGEEFNIRSPKQLGQILFEKLQLPTDKKTKSGYSTGAEVLEKLRPFHPIIDDILDYRQVTKLKSTYVDGLLKVADEDGRIHTEFRQTGTATGRLSSAEPNLQNIPIRTELGRELRRFFVPKSSEYVFIDADYSQIELRLLAHIAGDKAMRTAFLQGGDIHTSTASTVFRVPPEMVTPDMRKKAKAINFGILYGMGDFSLSQDLHISRARAKEYIANYLQSYPKVNDYLKDVVRQGYEQGYVTTMFGRRRYIPELSGQNKMIKAAGERIAMNSPIQGTAADIIKLAMIGVHRKLEESKLDARLILQVHDELLVEVRREQASEALELLKQEMEHAVELSVPLDVGSAIGDNWFDAK